MRSLTFILLSLLPAAHSDAAGLIRDVPVDGTAVVFEFEQTGTAIVEGKDFPISSKGTLRLAVVGTQEVAGLKCRWIEIELKQTAKFGETSRTLFDYWKVLMPQRDLIAGKDLESMAFKIYTADDPEAKEPRLVLGKEGRRVILRELREFLPQAPTKDNRINAVVNSRTVKTPAGEFDCDCRVFDGYADLYLHGPSRLQASSIYRVWTNKQSPIGVVAMEVQSESQQVSAPAGRYAEDDYQLQRSTVSTVKKINFLRIKQDVTSRFPNHR